MICDNHDPVFDIGPYEDVRVCPQCSAKFCVHCRQSKDQCPLCGSSVVVNAACSLTGGCGDGSQESK